MPTQDAVEAVLNPQLWVEAHGDALFRYALVRVRDRHIAEDLVQETFLGALRAQNSFGGRASERTWLVAILRHKIIDHMRKQGRESFLDDGTGDDELIDRMFDSTGHWLQGPKAWPDPSRALEANEFWEVFRECVKALPTRHGEVYALHAAEGQSTEEVCKAFRITPSNLWVILHRTRLRLRNCLEKNWFGVGQGRCDG